MKAPQYRKLHSRLKKQILGGEFLQGDLLPSENALSMQYGITRNTVRQALLELEREGYIIKKQGKGSVVHQKRLTLGLLTFKGFSEVLADATYRVNTETLAPMVKSVWPDNFFYALEKNEIESGCIGLSRLRYVEDNPVIYELTYIPDMMMPSLTGKKIIHTSLFQILAREYEIEITYVMQDLRAEKADQKIAHFLKMKTGQPILHIYRKYSTNKKGFFIYSSLYCNTGKYYISNMFE
jgi:GntR family transcriptional regulator/GntR family frlABCD operon transcriptional regulator